MNDEVGGLNTEPQLRPQSIDPIAADLLGALEHHDEARVFVLGGYFALKHYVDYRATRDVDAWWTMESTPAERTAAVAAAREALQRIATARGLEVVDRSRDGRVVSLDVESVGAQREKIFSLQVAGRDVELEPPRQSGWPPIRIEALTDNLGSKMSALVQRGAPRDFMDVRTVVQRGLASVPQLWDLWQKKNPGLSIESAKAQVLRNLAQIEMRAPIESAPADRREGIAAARSWYRGELTSSPARDRQRSVDRDGPER